MACDKFKVGDKVRFRGTKHPTEDRALSVHSGGPDVFEATIKNKPYGVCYGLEYENGSPVGLPFHDFQLELVE